MIVEKCGAFLPLAGDKAGSVAYTGNGCPTLRAESPTACVVGIDFYNGATTGKVSKTITSAATDSDHIPCVIRYDARGNGDGDTVPTITGDHNNRLTDYTALVCEKFAENSSGDGISGTIDAHYYLGCGARGGKEREFVVCEIHCYSQDAYDKYEETEHAATLRAPGGIYGGGSENLVCKPVYCLQGNGIDRADTAGCNGKGVTENVSYTLNTVDRHAVCCEAEGHTHDFLVRMREGKDGGGKGALVQEDKSGTIACNNDQVLFQRAETQYIVRRLTPLECCRLQGMPDFWTDGVEGSDAARYKLWGNGMALPNALYVMEGIARQEKQS